MVLEDQGRLQPSSSLLSSSSSSSSSSSAAAASLQASSLSTGMWVVTIPFDTLSGLSERSINIDDKKIDDDSDVFPMRDIRSNLVTSQFNMDNVMVVDEYRCQIKTWINYCLSNLQKVDGRVKSFVCDHLLSSPEHASVLHSMILSVHSTEDNSSSNSTSSTSSSSSNNQALAVSSNKNNNSQRSDSWLSSTISVRPSKWRGSSAKAKTVISSPSSTTTSYQSTMKPSSVGASNAYAKVVKYSRSVLSDASYLRKRCEVVHEENEEEHEDIDGSGGANAVDGSGGGVGGGGIQKDKFIKTAAVMVSSVVRQVSHVHTTATTD
jgi:hypothetical protein